MVKIRDISEYYFLLRNADLEKVKELHKTTGEFRKSFLENHILQDVLLNKGYEVKDRPESFLDIIDSTFNRTKTLIHLACVNYLMDSAINPQLAVVTIPTIIIPGEEFRVAIENTKGVNFESIEEFQEQWMKNPISQTVRKYQEQLNSAFDEYNMKFMLNLINRARINSIAMGDDWVKERKLQDIIENVADSKAYYVLDSAYYDMGNRSYRGCGRLRKELNENNFGKMFILDMDEMTNVLRKVHEIRFSVAEIDKNYKTNKKKIYKLDTQKHSQSGQDS